MAEKQVTPTTVTPKLDIKGYFQQLLKKSASIFDVSTTTGNSPKIAASHIFVDEMGVWCKVLSQRPEAQLLKTAALEYEFALLAVTQGHYGHAFRGLRLVLELVLQSAYLSANELLLREWLGNRADTSWSAITDKDQGVFSHRFAKAFFPELTEHVQHYRELAVTIYRECSECVHRNAPKSIPMPASLRFDQGVFDLWHSKAESVVLTAHFALSLRHLCDLSENQLSDLEHALSEHLGHLEEVRRLLGGPAKG